MILLKKKTPIIDVSSTTIKAIPLHTENVENILAVYDKTQKNCLTIET